MPSLQKHFHSMLMLLSLSMGLFLIGCNTTGTQNGSVEEIAKPKSSAVLRSGDTLNITLQGIPDPSNNDVQIDEKGFISLPYIDRIQASGNTSSELSNIIRGAYIERKIYRDINVAVYVTDRYIYVGGEVAGPGRVLWTTDLTLTKAIQSAGGFSLYADESDVQLTRDQTTYTLNVNIAQRDPESDPKLFPGDSVNVPRSAF